MEIKREYYLKQLIDKQGNGLIKIVTGLRRCGKSYLLDPMFKNYLLSTGVNEKHIIKIDLDIRENSKYLDPDVLNRYVKSKIIDNSNYYIILDEVQKVKDFESVLNGFLKMGNVDVYVTGSNSKFLSKDIITEFRGRGDDIHVYPLSFAEFYSVYEGDRISTWKEYITYGGLPLVLNQKTNEGKVNYLNNQQKNVYLNDVIERNKIKNDKELYELIRIISSSVGSLTNPTKLYNTFVSKGSGDSISDKTIYNYLSYLEDAFIIEKSSRYDIKGKKYIETPYKYYFVDIGIRNSLLGFRQIEENHIMENVIYIELKRRGFNVDVGVVETTEKNKHKKLEIDFIVNKGYDRYYIQSALNIDSEEKKQQELRPLLNVKDFFKRIVVVNGDIPMYKNEEGILIIGIFDFLLNENSLDF